MPFYFCIKRNHFLHMQYLCKYKSPIGALTLASDGENLTGLWVDGQAHFPSDLGNAIEKEDLPVFKQTIQWLTDYFKGKKRSSIPQIAPQGTDFRKKVWDILLEIPYGELVTYKSIADKLSERENGKFISPRAVGGAVGRNPISILIPCHRVIGSNGSLTGYAGGLERKVYLLSLEGIAVDRFKK